MKPKILILAVFPAPYRSDLFLYYQQEYDVDVFFERDNDFNRNSSWFSAHGFHVLNCKSERRLLKAKMRFLKQYSFACFFDYTSSLSMLIMEKCHILGIPYSVNCDGVIIGKKKSAIRDQIKKHFVKRAAACFASGSHAKQYFLSLGAKENHIFMHHFSTLEDSDILKAPLSNDEKVALRQKIGLITTKKIAICVGRFIRLKRFDWLISNWPAGIDSPYLLVVGGGDERDHYLEIIKQRKLSNVVLFEYKNKEDLISLYRASDVFIHPTQYDAWGLVVNEAMAAGLPVLVSNTCVAALELVVPGKNGFLFKPDDFSVIDSFLSNTLNDDGLCFSMGLMSTCCIRKYTIKQMAYDQLSIIRKFTSNN